jgi:hypothetical protein
MRFRSRVLQPLAIAAMASCFFVACSGMDRPESLPLEPIPITDTKIVAGVWEGIMVRTPASRGDDWVTVRIQEDGTYHFEAVRTIGVLSGSGRFDLRDGMLFAKSDKGSISLQLQHHVGMDDRLLKAAGQSADGMTYSASLTPKGSHH